jgi:hypothetical protein
MGRHPRVCDRLQSVELSAQCNQAHGPWGAVRFLGFLGWVWRQIEQNGMETAMADELQRGTAPTDVSMEKPELLYPFRGAAGRPLYFHIW